MLLLCSAFVSLIMKQFDDAVSITVVSNYNINTVFSTRHFSSNCVEVNSSVNIHLRGLAALDDGVRFGQMILLY